MKNNLKFITLFMLLLLIGRINAQGMQRIVRNQMEVQLEVVEGYLKIQMEAPTNGWLAVGLNTQNQLKGTSLLMGRVREGRAEVVDYYVQNPGDYHPVTALGGFSVIENVAGTESGQHSKIVFKVPLSPKGRFHHQIEPGKTYYLLMAYSRDDDFQHHSIMRTSVEVQF